ncbi:MAG: T9SS type A sorting domain-containing protein [Crocinitomicaceae bacterium]
MKKSLLFSFSVFSLFGAFAQQQYTTLSAKQNRNDHFETNKAKPSVAAKAEGDTIWSNNFDVPAEWTMATGPGHTAGAWQIVTALTPTLVSQVGTYGFPSAMNSTSGGNFALIDSDAQGGGQTQNAWIELANGIDLSSYGSTVFSLRFKEIYRHYYDLNFVDVSNDGGTTWTIFPVNTVAEVPVNTNSDDPSIETLNITSAIGAGTWGTNVKIRFRYEGAWDWFWGIDDVQIIETYQNDMKVTNFYTVTDTTSTQGLDYFYIPNSQSSFPGLTFLADVYNNGAANQPSVALTATSGAYNQTGTAVSVNSGTADSVNISVPFMVPTAIGAYTVDMTTTLPSADANPSDNEKSVVVNRHANFYSRDDNNVTGSIAQVSSQTDLPLKIGNIMEIFDPMDVYSVHIRLMNQPTAVDQSIKGEIQIFDGNTGDFVYAAETVDHVITTADLGTFVKIDIDGGPLSLLAGDVILLMATHNGGADEVAFGYAQKTQQGTVLGYVAAGTLFSLTDPGAIMIRLSDFSDLGLSENAQTLSMSVYPNPAADVTNVKFEAKTQGNAVVTVTDMTGKIVQTKSLNNIFGVQTVEVKTSDLNAGIYFVNVSTNGETATKKLTVK